jgi:hypothetical protein
LLGSAEFEVEVDADWIDVLGIGTCANGVGARGTYVDITFRRLNGARIGRKRDCRLVAGSSRMAGDG